MTIFDTPILTPLLRGIALLILKLMGWRVDGDVPDVPKLVVTFAPHTSNWDFPIVVLFALVFRMKLLWMGKDSLFRAPFGPMFTWLGGLPVDRSKSNNVVAQMIQYFHDFDRLAIGIAPEGTRGKVGAWKTGFYHIAHGAQVPIAPSFLDYRRKVGGFAPLLVPTGDIESEMRQLQTFYAGVTGKNMAKKLAATEGTALK